MITPVNCDWNVIYQPISRRIASLALDPSYSCVHAEVSVDRIGKSSQYITIKYIKLKSSNCVCLYLGYPHISWYVLCVLPFKKIFCIAWLKMEQIGLLQAVWITVARIDTESYNQFDHVSFSSNVSWFKIRISNSCFIGSSMSKEFRSNPDTLVSWAKWCRPNI